MNGDNLSGADDQQGRSRGMLTPDYISGFVDGEGCFSVSIRLSPSVRVPVRWYIQPVFSGVSAGIQRRDTKFNPSVLWLRIDHPEGTE